MFTRSHMVLAGLAAAFAPFALLAADPPPPPVGPAYQILLRSRDAEVMPNRFGEAQTGGGSIQVEQPEPNTIVVTMGGAAVVGSHCHPSTAGIDFKLEQDLEIVPLRPGVRPPRIGMVGRVVGTVQVTDPGKCGKTCGTAEQGPATATLVLGETGLLTIAVKRSNVSCGQELGINHREGPVECPSVPGCYRLVSAFHIGAN